jgi:uncharacterized membrane protein YbhN (UPF0104 family)
MISVGAALALERQRSREIGVGGCEILACGVLFVLLLYFLGFVELYFEPGSELNRFFLVLASASGGVILLLRFPLSGRCAWPGRGFWSSRGCG